MKNTLRIGVIFLFILGVVARAADSETTVKAQEAAKAWLALVDAEQYGESWDQAAALFRGGVSKTDWEKAVKPIRSQLGALKSRALKSANLTRSLPGAPDGEYVVIQFNTRFEKKAAALETVTPMRDKDGSWRVAGYYIN
ncbi:MAG: DUF4019 domain-containing protein [Candidatus Competibacter sp.]